MARALASRLRDRVTIQETHLVDNGRGGRKPANVADRWRNLATVAAEVVLQRGSEAVRNSIEREVATYQVTIRARAGVRPANRLIWHSELLGDVALDIKSAGLTEQRDAIVMICQSGGLD